MTPTSAAKVNSYRLNGNTLSGPNVLKQFIMFNEWVGMIEKQDQAGLEMPYACNFGAADNHTPLGQVHASHMKAVLICVWVFSLCI